MRLRTTAILAAAAVALGVAGSATAGRTGSSGWESAPFRSFSPYGTTTSGTWDKTHTYAVNGKKRTCTLTRGAKCVGAQMRGKVKHHGDLRRANLRRADLRFADLRGANLRGADLRSANLKYADLRGANLKGAKFHYAAPVHGKTAKRVSHIPACAPNCEGADLTNANLTNANLTNASLDSANLTGANLTNAYLYNAYLISATLTSANLTGAYLRDAIFRGTPCPNGTVT
ncbi:MAG: pentapeptide repeat-containing protein, partial [Actinomycetota bacterium]|nr:pentapeptide repeat-containing protein [Actinomycetota bacterium]